MLDQNFINYYKQNLQLETDDFDAFIHTLEQPLPYTIRVDDTSLEHLFHNNPNFKKSHHFENTYQCDMITYKNLPNKDDFTNYTNIGKLYRQEIVSMLPVHYLNINENNSVIDMCAAPGSKTTQILKLLESGYLISNDSNRKRSEIIKTHINNFNKPNVLITNNDARFYPRLRFDRVLCDVPCSGDGTMRKNYLLRKGWKQTNMFKMQYGILKRGLEMVKEDGLLVYSTCSFNPVENEAVVQRAVIELGCEILKVEHIHGMIMRNGLKKWDPMVEKGSHNQWLFPAEKNINQLENCIRIYPHDNNTGGFFVAVLKAKIKAKLSSDLTKKSSEKVTELEDQEENEAKLIYRSSNKVDEFYNICKKRRIIIEEQFKIKIPFKMISQSENCKSISIITRQLYEIIESAKTLNIISGGCKAFNVNDNKGQNLISYRAKAGILNLFHYVSDNVYILKDRDAQLFINNQQVNNEDLSFQFKETGICVVKFKDREELYNVWVGQKSSMFLCDRNHKNALRSLINN